MHVVVAHNLGSGGARRRLANQLAHVGLPWSEVCLETAEPISGDAHVVPVRSVAARAPRWARAPLRYADHAALMRAWRTAAKAVAQSGADVLFANPCQVLQAPPALAEPSLPPSLYFCDEPRRVDYEPEAFASRNPTTMRIYGRLYAAQRAADRRAVLGADVLATNSAFTAANILAAYGREAIPVVLGAARIFFGDDRPGASKHILSVGTLIPSKGHDLVIRAAALASERRPVLVVGPRAEAGEVARLEALAGQLDIELTVALGVTDGELAAAYRDAYALLYLAHREPLGLASIEAQAAGCPVIVAAEGGLPETVDDGTTGYAVPRTPEAAAQALDRLAEHERGALAHACRSWAAGFTWEASALRVRELLEQACARPPLPAGSAGR